MNQQIVVPAYSGGSDAITAVVDDFVGRCAADARINPKFARTDVPRLKAMLVEQVSMATGGPVQYTGRSMDATHRGMQVTAGEFDALDEDLAATLDRFGVPDAAQAELLGILARSAATSSRWSRRRRERRCPTRTRRRHRWPRF